MECLRRSGIIFNKNLPPLVGLVFFFYLEGNIILDSGIQHTAQMDPDMIDAKPLPLVTLPAVAFTVTQFNSDFQAVLTPAMS